MLHKYRNHIIITFISCLLFLPFLGAVHLFDWDEINFAECAREMIVSGDYLRPQIDFMPFWEKPPLFIWLQMLSMKMFGSGEFAARLPNALAGIATLLTLYHCGKRLVNEKAGLWWVVLYAASWLPHFYFKTGIIDPLFNLFIFAAFYQVYRMRLSERSATRAIAAGLLLGLAVLTKGPVAILVAILSITVYFIINKGLNGYRLRDLIIIAVGAAIPFAMWMAVTSMVYGAEQGGWFLKEFIQYQIRLFSTEDSDHGGPFFYHFIVLLLGCFPASAFLFQYTRKPAKPKNYTDFTRLMWIMFWVVLLLFSIVKTKIVHYSSLCYFPLTWLAAIKVYEITSGEKTQKMTTIMYTIVGTLFGLLITLLPLVAMNKELIIPYIADPFAVANFRADVTWSYAACIPGIIYLASIFTTGRLLKKNPVRAIMISAGVHIIVIQSVMLYFTPRIEGYSQRAAINYFERFKGQDVYVHPLGYKSYANLFYTDKQPGGATAYKGMRRDKTGRETPQPNEEWLIHGQTDKPAYFISKIQDSTKYNQIPELEQTGSSNGFIFFKKRQ